VLKSRGTLKGKRRFRYAVNAMIRNVVRDLYDLGELAIPMI